MSAIVLENAAFAYPSAPDSLVLEGLSAEIPLDGRTLVLGGNGSGKTALARLLSGLDNPANGVVRWPNELTVDGQRQAAPHLRAGVVFEQPEFQFQGITVVEELCSGLLYQGIAAPQAGEMAREVALRYGLDNLLQSSLESLDYPSKMAVLISSFLLLRPRLLVLDFSLAELDQGFRAKLLANCNGQSSPALVVLSRGAEDIFLLGGADLFILNNGGLHPLNVSPDDPRANKMLLEAGIAMASASIPPLQT